MLVIIRQREAFMHKLVDTIGEAFVVAFTLFWTGAMTAISVSVVLPEHAGDWNKLLQIAAVGGVMNLANYYRQSPLAPPPPIKKPEGGE